MTDERFIIATRATGRRRTVLVIVHDTAEEMRRIGQLTIPAPDEHGNAAALCHCLAYQGEPDHVPLIIRFHRGELYTEVIAHESTHAAAELVHADCIRPESRARTYLHSAYEPLAYAVGELTQRIVTECFRRHLIAA